MNAAETGADYISAPPDYDALFRLYYEYVLKLLRKSGIHENHKEDMAQEILARFYERDSLADFNPDLVFEYDGESRPAKFKSYLTKFVLTYAKGKRDKQQRVASRELLLCDRPVGEGSTAWIDVFGGVDPAAEDDVLERLDEQNLITEMREYLCKVPRKSRYDSCDLVALFDEVVRQVRETGTWNVPELRQHFGIGSTAMHTWMWSLREHLARALGRPTPAKRPRVLRPAWWTPSTACFCPQPGCPGHEHRHMACATTPSWLQAAA